MNAYTHFSTRWFFGWLGVCALTQATVFAEGIPEPSLIFYGTVRSPAQNNLPVHTGTIAWQIRNVATGRTIVLTTALGNYSGLSYVLEVPAESIVSGPVSSNVLELSTTERVFDRSQTSYEGTPVVFASLTQTNFTASSLARGRLERVDLLVSTPPCPDADGNGLCDDWELAYWGQIGLVGANDDFDGDGMSNLAEYLAGTDPTDPNSVLRFVDYGLVPGGMRVEWQSAEGRFYSLWRTTNVWSFFPSNQPTAPDFTVVRSNIMATPPRNVLIDTNAASAGAYFYRVALEP